MDTTGSITKRLKAAYREQRLGHIVKSRLRPLKYVLHSPGNESIRLDCPDYRPSDPADAQLVERIFEAYKRMKKDEASAKAVYIPSSLWRNHLDKDYVCFSDALRDDDIAQFHFFLENFGAWRTYHGIESTTLITDNMRPYFKRRHVESDYFLQPLKMWHWYYNNKRDLSLLSYPRFGNQVGALVDDQFIGAGSFFNEIYGSILSGLVAGDDRPVIADLGGGYGKLAYFTLRDLPDFSFVDFDLPEVLCLATYYLMKSFPSKQALLYGEAPYSEKSHGEYDLIFMPSFKIEDVGSQSVDLFLNKNSLGEMSRESVENYVSHIGRATSRYFFHMNHDNYPNIYENGKLGLLGSEFPVPRDEFNLLLRYADIGALLSQGWIDLNTDIFFYLYERKMKV